MDRLSGISTPKGTLKKEENKKEDVLMRISKVFVFAAALFLCASVFALDVRETETLHEVTQLNQDGFGARDNKYAFSMAVFRDKLYVGTLNIKRMPGMIRFFTATTGKRASNGAEVWRYDGEEWTRVVDSGLDSHMNIGVRKMVAGEECLWAVTANHDQGMEVWRTCDGDLWEAVIKGGFGDKNNTSGRGMGFFKGHLYVGTENRKQGAQLWRTEDGEHWEKVADNGIMDKGNWWMSDFAEFKGRLYTGTLNAAGMQAYRTADGVHFERLFEGGLSKWTNTAGMKVYVFKDRLFLGTMDFFRGFDLYVSEDGKSFERVLAKGHTNRHNAYLWQLVEYEGRLYAGTYFHKGISIPSGKFMLYSSPDGLDWTVENDNAFGNPYYYGVRSTAVYQGRLIIGTASAKYGCKIIAAKKKP